jgi:hypothetical protein
MGCITTKQFMRVLMLKDSSLKLNIVVVVVVVVAAAAAAR